MLLQPPALLQESIDKLEQLRAALHQQVGAAAACAPCPADRAIPAALMPGQPPGPEQRLGKELLLTIGVLLPKLQAARRIQLGTLLAARGCPSCEE